MMFSFFISIPIYYEYRFSIDISDEEGNYTNNYIDQILAFVIAFSTFPPHYDWRIILLHKRSNIRAIVSLITVLSTLEGLRSARWSLQSDTILFILFFNFRFFRKTEMLVSKSDPEMICSYRARYIQGCAVAQRSRLSVITRFNECESTLFCLLLPLRFSQLYNGVMWHRPFLFWQLTLSPWITMTQFQRSVNVLMLVSANVIL